LCPDGIGRAAAPVKVDTTGAAGTVEVAATEVVHVDDFTVE